MTWILPHNSDMIYEAEIDGKDLAHWCEMDEENDFAYRKAHRSQLKAVGELREVLGVVSET